MSEPVCLDSLEFLSNVTETYWTDVIFTFDIGLAPSGNLICTVFLTLEFDVIFEHLVFKNDGHWLRIFFVREGGPKVLRT